MAEKLCTCPYIICPIHGNCEACIAKSMGEGELTNCMERIAEKNYAAKLPLKQIRTEVAPDFEGMSLCSAEKVRDCLNAKPDALLCFAAGNTDVRTFEILKDMQDRKEIDFSQARFVALDDWLDLEDESDNCTHFMFRHFYGPLGIRDDQLSLWNLHVSDLAAECRRMDAIIAANGGVDLMLLGMGMNGHLGLNEPHVPWNRRSLVVDLDPVTTVVGQKYFSKPAKLTRGITLGMLHVFEAHCVILQVGEKKKAEIVKRLFDTQPDFPIAASALKMHPNAVMILDEDAASLLGDYAGILTRVE